MSAAPRSRRRPRVRPTAPLDRNPLLGHAWAMQGMIETPSPNFDERKSSVSMIVLHYTGMLDAESAIHWLANPESKVSAHYLVTEEGEIVRMVAEEKRAW